MGTDREAGAESKESAVTGMMGHSLASLSWWPLPRQKP